MFNLNEKNFPIGERCGRNNQNKFCLRLLRRRFSPWELKRKSKIFEKNAKFSICLHVKGHGGIAVSPFEITKGFELGVGHKGDTIAYPYKTFL